MLYPSIDRLMERLDSKYTLVALAAKRARELRNPTATRFVEKPVSGKFVGVALEEILSGHITHEHTAKSVEAQK